MRTIYTSHINDYTLFSRLTDHIFRFAEAPGCIEYCGLILFVFEGMNKWCKGINAAEKAKGRLSHPSPGDYHLVGMTMQTFIGWTDGGTWSKSFCLTVFLVISIRSICMILITTLPIVLMFFCQIFLWSRCSAQFKLCRVLVTCKFRHLRAKYLKLSLFLVYQNQMGNAAGTLSAINS
jgi:hypothetical protein